MYVNVCVKRETKIRKTLYPEQEFNPRNTQKSFQFAYPEYCLEGKLPLKPGSFVTRAPSGADDAGLKLNAI